MNNTVCMINTSQIENETIEVFDWESQIFFILSLLIGCVGVVGNCLNFLVLHAYPTSQVTFGGECTARVNLLGLAVADFMVCLTSLPLSYSKRWYTTYNFMLYYTIIGPGLVTYFLTVSVWMVLLMSIVRYLVVCKPLTSRACLTSRHMFRVIGLLYVFALLFHIPSFLEYTHSESEESHQVIPCTNASSPVVNRSLDTFLDVNVTNEKQRWSNSSYIFVMDREFWNDETVRIAYSVSQIIFTNIGPFIGVLISNISVIRACRRSDACRNIMSNEKHPSVTNQENNSNMRSNHRYLPRPIGMMHRSMNHPVARMNVWRMGSQTKTPIQRIQQRATNRVTPLLLAVILAFLLFTAPFGIVHFVCLQMIREMGMRIRNDIQAQKLYRTLNSIVNWTNVVQLLGCASNFFLYFLVSTTFRRTTKRYFQRFYIKLRNCKCPPPRTICAYVCSSSDDSSLWESDIRTNQLRKNLEVNSHKELFPVYSPKDVFQTHSDETGSTIRNVIKQKFFKKNTQNHTSHNRSETESSFQPIILEDMAHSSPLPFMHSSATDKTTNTCFHFNQTHHPYRCYDQDATIHPHALLACTKCSHLMSGYVSLPESQLCLIRSPQLSRMQAPTETDAMVSKT